MRNPDLPSRPATLLAALALSAGALVLPGTASALPLTPTAPSVASPVETVQWRGGWGPGWGGPGWRGGWGPGPGWRGYGYGWGGGWGPGYGWNRPAYVGPGWGPGWGWRGCGWGGCGWGPGFASGVIVAAPPPVVYAAPPGNAVAYCMRRFRSYNPATGTYLGYDGLRHPCP